MVVNVSGNWLWLCLLAESWNIEWKMMIVNDFESMTYFQSVIPSVNQSTNPCQSASFSSFRSFSVIQLIQFHLVLHSLSFSMSQSEF